MIHAKMAAAMASWREQAADAKRQAHLAGGAIRRMMNRKLSMAWEQWQQTAAELRALADERRRKQMAMRRALMKWQLQQLSMGWNTWHNWYLERMEQLRLLRRGAMRMLQR